MIILRRSADSANAKQAVVAASTKAADAPSPVAAASAPNAMAESNVTEANETKSEAQAAGLSDTASNGGAAAPDAAEAPAQPPPSKPSKPAAPAAAARRRHSWEVMMEVVLPPKLRKLPMLSMQIVDMPVPAELLAPARRPQPGKQKAGQDAPAATEASPATNVTAVQPSAPVTTPVMVMLFQGGVLAALQLTVIGDNTAAPPPSTLASHFNHPPLSAQFNLDMLRSFLHVHWDLVLSQLMRCDAGVLAQCVLSVIVRRGSLIFFFFFSFCVTLLFQFYSLALCGCCSVFRASIASRRRRNRPGNRSVPWPCSCRAVRALAASWAR